MAVLSWLISLIVSPLVTHTPYTPTPFPRSPIFTTWTFTSSSSPRTGSGGPSLVRPWTTLALSSSLPWVTVPQLWANSSPICLAAHGVLWWLRSKSITPPRSGSYKQCGVIQVNKVNILEILLFLMTVKRQKISKISSLRLRTNTCFSPFPTESCLYENQMSVLRWSGHKQGVASVDVCLCCVLRRREGNVIISLPCLNVCPEKIFQFCSYLIFLILPSVICYKDCSIWKIFA